MQQRSKQGLQCDGSRQWDVCWRFPVRNGTESLLRSTVKHPESRWKGLRESPAVVRRIGTRRPNCTVIWQLSSVLRRKCHGLLQHTWMYIGRGAVLSHMPTRARCHHGAWPKHDSICRPTDWCSLNNIAHASDRAAYCHIEHSMRLRRRLRMTGFLQGLQTQACTPYVFLVASCHLPTSLGSDSLPLPIATPRAVLCARDGLAMHGTKRRADLSVRPGENMDEQTHNLEMHNLTQSVFSGPS